MDESWMASHYERIDNRGMERDTEGVEGDMQMPMEIPMNDKGDVWRGVCGEGVRESVL